jgi:adenosylmethionine-8-amino-7-oxononanoate aminotransferase
LLGRKRKEYIDAIASWWVNPYGHSNKYIADAIYKQLTTLEHVLLAVLHMNLLFWKKLKFYLIINKSVFSDNGSTAVEVAIKVALQFFFNKGENEPQ